MSKPNPHSYSYKIQLKKKKPRKSLTSLLPKKKIIQQEFHITTIKKPEGSYKYATHVYVFKFKFLKFIYKKKKPCSDL